MNNTIAASNDIIEWWLAYSYRTEKGKIVPKNFKENKTERTKVGEFLQKHSIEKNDKNYEELKKAIYNNGIICEIEILDEKDDHDPLAFFSISYICSIFWLVEDSPVYLDNPSNDNFKQHFLKEIELIANGLLEENSQNTQNIVKGVLGLYKITRLLDRPTAITEVEKPKINFEVIGEFSNKDSEFKKYLLSCWNTSYHQFDVYSLFDPNNYKDETYLETIIDNIYYNMYNMDCNLIVGIERGGIPLASLVAYRFNIPCHILRTVPLLKVLPKLPFKNKIALFDDTSITGSTKNQATKYIKETYSPEILVSLCLVGENEYSGIDRNFISMIDSNKIKFKLKNFKKSKDQELENEKNIDLKELLIKRCINGSKKYWHSESTYNQGVFNKVCDWFYKEIYDYINKNGKSNQEFVIIATSIYGLPYASVASYKLKKPLFLFSRRSNYKHDFRLMSLENLQNKIYSGLQNVILVDDIYESGITNQLIRNKLITLGIKEENIKSFVVANFSDKNINTPVSCLNKKDFRICLAQT